MVTSKELVESALRREEVDRIPFCPPFQGYWALNNAGISVMDSIKNPKIAAEAQLAVTRSCGMDAVETMWDWLLPAEAMGCKVKIPDHGTIPTASHVINDTSDLDRLKIPDMNDFYRLAGARETTRIMADRIGNDHFLMASLLSPFTLAGELRGVEQMMMDCVIEEDFINELVRTALEIDRHVAEDMVRWNIDAVIICDPTASGDLISADDYAKYSKSSTKALGDTIRAGGKMQIGHICGDTSDRLDHIADTGCQAFSMDHHLDVISTVKRMNKRIAIIGNINPAAVLFSGNPEMVRKETERILIAGGKKGFLFGSGCDVPVGSSLENIRAISETIIRF